MRVDWLSLVDYRSYRNLDWRPEREVNLLIGPNGAGKTNVLESIAYLSSLKSFRSVPDASVINMGAETTILRSGITGSGRDRLVEIEIRRNGPRRVQVDKTRPRRNADLVGVLRVIAFLPEDLDLVKRGPAYRRNIIDEVAVQLWPSAYVDQAEYDRAVRQRNAFLKSGERDDVTLSVWDSRLAQAGGRVMARRMGVIQTLSPLLDASYEEISGGSGGAGFTYDAPWTEKTGSAAARYAAALSEALDAARRRDYERRVTTVGPHRDEPGFSLEGRDARTQASQGEQRTLALAVKLAAHAAVTETIGEPPVLLLDDVFSELDAHRAAALAGALPDDTQIMISTARPEDVPVAGKTWTVGDGGIR